MFEKYPDIMNVEQLCDALKIGKNTAYKLIKESKIKTIRIGTTHKIPKKWLVEFFTAA